MAIVLIPIGVLLLYLAERYLFKTYWNRGLDVRLAFSDKPVNEGDLANISEVITNRNFLPLPIVTVSFQTDNGVTPKPELQKGDTFPNVTVSDRTSVVEVFSVKLYERITRQLTLACEKRGYYAVLQASATSTDLFNNQVGYMNFPQNTSLYVYPARLTDAETEVPYRRVMGEVLSRIRLYEDPFSFRGIRDYTPLDPPSAINWKATARTNDLRVNEKDYTAGQTVLILLDLEDPAVLFDTSLLEDCIRYTYNLALRLISEKIPVGIATNGRDILEDAREFRSNAGDRVAAAANSSGRGAGQNSSVRNSGQGAGQNSPGLSALKGIAMNLAAGSSAAHATAVSEFLSRIDLRKNRAPFAEVISAAANNSSRESEIVCLIGSCQRDDVIKAANDLARARGSLTWLCPLRTGMELRAEGGEYDFIPLIRK